MNKFILFFFITLICCNKNKSLYFFSGSSNVSIDKEFKDYWFDGKAEVSSYNLQQSRYGSEREGSAVLIFVTEDFLTNSQVKSNEKSKSSKLVLKLNRTKKFLTGIYPYSIMTSTFSLLGQTQPLVKSTTSIQEWCGHMFLQLNRRKNLEIQTHSYFEGEGDQKFKLKDAISEDDLWLWIRTQPDRLPKGEIEILPSLEFLSMNHKNIKLYKANTHLEKFDQTNTFNISYPKLNRKLSISFENYPPYKILGWEELDLILPDRSTRAKIKKSIRLPYWKLNKKGDEYFRDSLKLKI